MTDQLGASGTSIQSLLVVRDAAAAIEFYMSVFGATELWRLMHYHRIGHAHDRSAVVDQQGRVYGLDNLRVIDASIMPDCPSVNLNATVIMMAEKLADTYSKSPTASSTKSSRSIPV